MRPVISAETNAKLRNATERQLRGTPVSADDLDTEQCLEILLEDYEPTRFDDGPAAEEAIKLWDTSRN